MELACCTTRRSLKDVTPSYDACTRLDFVLGHLYTTTARAIALQLMKLKCFALVSSNWFGDAVSSSSISYSSICAGQSSRTGRCRRNANFRDSRSEAYPFNNSHPGSPHLVLFTTARARTPWALSLSARWITLRAFHYCNHNIRYCLLSPQRLSPSS